jgi:hypothetical protein
MAFVFGILCLLYLPDCRTRGDQSTAECFGVAEIHARAGCDRNCLFDLAKPADFR